MDIDVNHDVYSNKCSLLYSVFYFAKNILSSNLKVHFQIWRVWLYGILPAINRSILMYYLELTSLIKKKTLKVCPFKEKFLIDERGNIWIKYFRYCVGAPDCTATENAFSLERVHLWLYKQNRSRIGF